MLIFPKTDRFCSLLPGWFGRIIFGRKIMKKDFFVLCYNEFQAKWLVIKLTDGGQEVVSSSDDLANALYFYMNCFDGV